MSRWSVPVSLLLLVAGCGGGKAAEDSAAQGSGGGDRDGDGVADEVDCAPDDPATSAGSVWYADTDGDGYGDAAATVEACVAPLHYVADSSDCDDGAAAAHPGAAEIWYDGADEDCAGDSDFDQDGDGYDREDECDDLDASRYPDPSVTEIWYDGVDQNCDGNDGDQDGDGWYAADYPHEVPAAYVGRVGDCWDNPGDSGAWTPLAGFPAPGAAEVFPGAYDASYDGLDEDCAGDDDFDQDRDTFRSDAWPDADGVFGDDCDDTDGAFHPGAADAPYDGLDADCAGNDDYDQDLDGYDAPGGAGPVDCDDADGDVNPGASENCETAGDDDCDGDVNDVDAKACTTWFLDVDGDTYGASASVCTCTAAGAYSATAAGDCADADSGIHPGVVEVCDGIDQDCDGSVDDGLVFRYVDVDGDGFGSGTATCAGPGVVASGDCDDTRETVYPGASERCDAVQNNCTLSTWSAADEANLASVEAVDGTWFDATSALTGTSGVPITYTLPAGGTLHICPGLWYTHLLAPSTVSATTIDAPWGGATAILDGGSTGSVLTASTAGVSVTVRGVTLQNGAASYGGGIYASGATLLVEDSVVTANRATQAGGGIYASGGGVTVRRTSFSSNTTDGSAAALQASNTSLGIEDCAFTDNSAYAVYGAAGGAVAWSDSGADGLTVAGSTFEGNVIYAPAGYGYGGGLYVFATGTGAVDIRDTRFASNNVSSQEDAWGGGLAMFVSASSDVTLDAVDFEANLVGAENAPEGGAMYLWNIGTGVIALTDGSMTGNQSWGDRSNTGGGLSAYLAGSGDTSIERETFLDNATFSYGGAVGTVGTGGGISGVLDGASLDLSEVTVTANDALQGDGVSLSVTDGAVVTFLGGSQLSDNLGEGLAVHGLDLASTVDLVDTVVAGNDSVGLYLYPGPSAATNVSCQGSAAEAAGIYTNGSVGVFGYYAATGAVGYFSAVACDFDDPASGASNGSDDLAIGGVPYNYGADATFTCVGGVCL